MCFFSLALIFAAILLTNCNSLSEPQQKAVITSSDAQGDKSSVTAFDDGKTGRFLRTVDTVEDANNEERSDMKTFASKLMGKISQANEGKPGALVGGIPQTNEKLGQPGKSSIRTELGNLYLKTLAFAKKSCIPPGTK